MLKLQKTGDPMVATTLIFSFLSNITQINCLCMYCVVYKYKGYRQIFYSKDPCLQGYRRQIAEDLKLGIFSTIRNKPTR